MRRLQRWAEHLYGALTGRIERAHKGVLVGDIYLLWSQLDIAVAKRKHDVGVKVVHPVAKFEHAISLADSATRFHVCLTKARLPRKASSRWGEWRWRRWRWRRRRWRWRWRGWRVGRRRRRHVRAQTLVLYGPRIELRHVRRNAKKHVIQEQRTASRDCVVVCVGLQQCLR